jgi:hypothetical protein
MNEKIEALDKRNEAMRTLAVDLAYLRKTHQDLMVSKRLKILKQYRMKTKR